MKAGRQLLMGVPLLMGCVGLHGQADPLNDWQIIARPPMMELRGLAYKDGTFAGVAIGTNIVVSTNGGSDWSLVPIDLPNFHGAMAVTDGAGQFVAVGWWGNILTSPDGLQWTRRYGGAETPFEEFWAVTYGGGRFVAVGFQSTNFGAIAATSTDGIHWEKFRLPIATTPRNVAFGNELYVAAGSPVSMYSRNGRDWTPLNGVLAQGIAYGGGQFIATTTSSHGGYRSSNGMDWTAIPLPGLEFGEQKSHGNYYTAAYANGMFIIGGFCDGCPNTSRPSLLATSTDGTRWISRLFGADENIGPIRDIVFVDGALYLADSWGGKIWKSGRTPPINPPAFTQVSRSGGQASLSFTTVAGFRYRVESTERWGSSAWEPRVGPFFATGDQLTVSDPNPPDDHRFYRVRSD